jgi:lactoylglutathione lyase
MTSRARARLTGMTTTPAPQASLATAMFTVADQDAALAFYTDRLGWEVRGDTRYGPDGAQRWLEVAPPGSVARLALNPPMSGTPGGSSVGVEVDDVLAEHARLSAVGGIDLDPAPMEMEGAPLMFSLRDPDENYVWIVPAAD